MCSLGTRLALSNIACTSACTCIKNFILTEYTTIVAPL